MPTEETQLKKAVRQWLDWHGWFHFHLLATLGVYPGAPDRIAIKSGRVVCLEIKAKGKKLSKSQENFAANWQAHGGEYYLVQDLDDLQVLK